MLKLVVCICELCVFFFYILGVMFGVVEEVVIGVEVVDLLVVMCRVVLEFFRKSIIFEFYFFVVDFIDFKILVFNFKKKNYEWF